jgi:signal transduction histidine kinase
MRINGNHKQILHIVILFCIYVVITFFYYFNEFVGLMGISSYTWEISSSVHELHRLLFLIPIIYTAYIFRVKGALISTLVSFLIFLPRALFISPYPDPLLRVIIFIVIACAIGVLTGITRNTAEHHRILELSLKEERDMFYKILENMPDGVLIISPDYRIQFQNNVIRKDFGDGINRFCYEYLHGFDSPCDDICRLNEVMNGNIMRWEYAYQDGRTYELVASPFTDPKGKAGCLALLRNITKRKQLELELIQLNELKTDLLSNVSHELKSPLTSIKGIISSLLQKDIQWDEDTKQMLLEGISEETDRLSSLVTNILNMSKLESGVWQPEREARHIADILNDAIEQQQWIYKNYVYNLNIYSDMPEIMVDGNQIMQVLNNLLENAAAYSDAGSEITVNAEMVDSEIRISVADRGIGIAGEDVDKIFEKFHRGNQSRIRPGGIGLGLSICKSIVTAHGGRIWAESRPGKGTTFYFTLPVSPAKE